jgi:hypothetical protein
VTQAQFVMDLGNDVVLFAWAGSVAFLVVYPLLARGWRTGIGRALLRLDAGLTLALGPSVLHRLFGFSLESLIFSWYFVASIALVGFATWERVWFVIKEQARGAGLTPRQFAWHLLRGAWNAARRMPGRLRRPGDDA